MAKENSQEQENKIVAAAAKLAEAAEKARAPHDQAILAAVEEASAKIKKGAETVKEGTKSVVGGIKEAGAMIGNALKESYTSSLDTNIIARTISGDTGPSDEEIAAAEKEMKELMPGGDPAVARIGFHTSTFTPICTSNAILRCSFGLTFGPLNVLPMNRTCIGDAAHCVATLTDFLPQTNIPQFGLCFNILNPAVLAATTAATIAKGGVFTLTPMPCIGTAVPTPWIPTSTNLCGKTPILTQPSCSLCWGLGSINILHCGQGIEPSIWNYLRVPGDPMATIKGWVEGFVNLAGGLGGLVSAGKLAKNVATARKVQIAAKTAQTVKNVNNVKNVAQVAKTAQNISKLDKIVKNVERVGDGLDVVNNLHEGVTSAMDGDAGGAAAAFTGAAITGFTRGKAEFNDYKAYKAVNDAPLSDSFMQTKGNANRALLDREAAQVELNNADAKYTQAQTHEDIAKGFRDQSEEQLKKSKGVQTTKQKELTEAQIQENSAETEAFYAKRNQESANTNLENAQNRQKATEEGVKKAQETKKDTADKLKQAKERQAQVEADPNSTDWDKQKAKADTQYAEWNDNRAEKDLDKKQKANADAKEDVERKKQAKKDADENAQKKEDDLAKKKEATEKKQEEKRKADEQVEKDKFFLQEDEDLVKTKRDERHQAWKDREEKKEELQKKDEAHKKANQELKKAGEIENHPQIPESDPTTGDKVLSNVVGYGKYPGLKFEEEYINYWDDDDDQPDFDKFIIGYENKD